MILRRYGPWYRKVEPRFDARALTEVGFRSLPTRKLAADEFGRLHRKVAVHELAPSAEGEVQDETEALLLERLRTELLAIEDALGDSRMLVIENGSGVDYPKTRQSTDNVVVAGRNRLRFRYTLSPPLRVAVYAATRTPDVDHD